MHAQHYFFTSESVSEGHPDKVSDQISDAILDSLLAHDPMARVACETLCTTGLVVLAGEVTVHNQSANDALGQAEETVRATIKRIGYTDDPSIRFDDTSCAVIRTLHGQSLDIARGVDHASDNTKEPGAGDQGLMFGYACRETPELMPLAIHLSHRLVEKQAQARRQDKIPGLRPDAKSQVTIEYDAKNKPVRIDTVVLSTQHDARWNGAKKQKELKDLVIKHVIIPCMPKKLFDAKTVKIHVNPTGQFEIGGPHGDAGLTGRKIIVDTYGGKGRHGGGAFSGKDPSKVDRSAAYMARYVAKNLVASNLCDECEVQLSYAIGVAEPTSVFINTFGSNRIPESDLVKIVRKFVPLTPRGIINHLKLRAPIYSPTAAYGHFGRKPGTVTVAGKAHETFTWEKTDLAETFHKAAGLR